MYTTKSAFLLTFFIITFTLICPACDDDAPASSSSILSIYQLLGKANTVVLNKALACCMPTLTSEQSTLFESSIQPSLNAFNEAETNGWIKFNVDQANQCFEAFKTKVENSSCEALNQPTSDLYKIDIKACNIYERLQTENQPCGILTDEGYVIEELGVCLGDLYCSKIKLDDQKRPTCQIRQSGASCGSVDIFEDQGSLSLTPEICPNTETCGFQKENEKIVAKCITKVSEGAVCGEVKKDAFGISIDLDYGNCDDGLVCGIQEKDGTIQALCMKQLVFGDICQIDYTYTYEAEMINTFLSYDCPNQTVCLKTDEKYTCQLPKKINETCGEIDNFGLGISPFANGICENGLVCRSKYQDVLNVITCQPLAQIGESCKNTWSIDPRTELSYDYSDENCVVGAICQSQGRENGEDKFTCIDDPETAMIGESCDANCAGETVCDRGICRSIYDHQSLCEEIQSIQ